MTRKFFIVAALFSGLLLSLLAVMALLGTSIPEKHSVSVETQIPAAPSDVWNTLTDKQKAQAINPELQAIKESTDLSECEWLEVYTNQTELCFEFETIQEPYELRKKIVSSEAPFQVQWSYNISEISPNMSLVKVTETGSIANPLIRFLAHNFIGLESFVQSHLDLLKSHFEK